MQAIRIEYRFRFEGGSTASFELELDGETLELVGESCGERPAWTELGFRQCTNCPLTSDLHPHCPLAVKLVPVVDRFAELLSYSQVQLEVRTRERTVFQSTTAQDGLSSLMGLIMATSGCPHTAFFRPMARFHLPLAGIDETTYRAAGMYLLAQYFVRRAGGEPDLDLDGLLRLYEEVETVNAGVADRLRAAAAKDSTLNAVVVLDSLAKSLPIAIEESLEDLRLLFSPSYV